MNDKIHPKRFDALIQIEGKLPIFAVYDATIDRMPYGFMPHR